jgi:hypothetical protein
MAISSFNGVTLTQVRVPLRTGVEGPLPVKTDLDASRGPRLRLLRSNLHFARYGD